MKKQDFYGLPRSIQDRFIESSQGVAAPAPVAVAPRSPRAPLIWWGLSALFAAIWAWTVSLGYGDLHSSLAISSLPLRIGFMALAGAACFCALRAIALTWALGRLPYGPGDYLFPSGVINASFPTLTQHDSREITEVTAQGAKVVVRSSGGTFAFSAESKEQAENVTEMFGHQRSAWQGVAEGEPLDRARLDPLTDGGLPNPLAPTEPHQRPRMLPEWAVIGLAALLGILAGYGIASWRDSMSQKALYRAAVSQDSVGGYQAFLERGGNRKEVSDLLLPRAELREAISQGSVEAIVEFKRRHPDTQIAGEVQNALRAELLRELSLAKQKGTLAAIEAIPKRFADHALIAGELKAARRDIYVTAMGNFLEQASDADEGLTPFVQRLLTYAETHGPVVKLRIHQEFPQDPKKLDKIVRKAEKYFMGNKSLPTQYVLGEHARRREKALLEKVRARLQEAFPIDVLRFELDAPPSAENLEPPAPTVPTLTFMHRERLSGGYVGGKPKAMYMGVALHLSAQAEIPGDPEPAVSYKWNAWKNPKFSILVDREKDIPDVYEEMVGGAFEKFADLYLGRWF